MTRIIDVGSITPSGLALSSQGSLFFSGVGAASTPRPGGVFITEGGTFSPFLTGLQQPRGLGADSNALYVADEAAGEIWRVMLKEATDRAEHASGTHSATTGVEAALSAAKRKSAGSSQNTSGSSNAVTSSTSVTTALGGINPLAGCQNSPPDKPDPGDGPWGGEPVNMASGVYELQRTDLVIPGLMPIIFKYIYRTENAGQAGRMGIGGSDCYDYRIRGGGNNELLFALPTNDRFSFMKQPDGTYINTDTYWLAGARLYDSGIDGEARYTLRFKNGTKFYFGPGYYSYALNYIIDANGNQLHLVTSGGDLLQIQQPSGRTLSVTTENGNITRITDTAGRSVSYVYSNNYLVAVSNALGGVTSYTYETNKNLRTITLPNQVQFLQNIYDSNNRVVTQMLADGGSYTFNYTPQTGGYASMAAVAAPVGGTTTHYANSAGFNTNSVNAVGVAVATVRSPSNGAPAQVIDGLSRTNSSIYDSACNVVLVTNAMGKITRFTYEPVYNRLTSVVDPLGRTNSFGYDGRGNLTSITNAVGKITTITYNQFGQPLTVTDPLSNTYTFTYNETLDLSSVTDPLGNQVKRFVDSVGRTYALVDPFGRTTRITYTDQTGCGSCAGAPDLVASIVDSLNGTTSFGYDSVGNLTNVTDALNHTVSYGYDGMSRLTSRTDQLGRQEICRYDKNGNVTNFVDRRGISVAFKYDTLDQRTGVVYGTQSNVRLFYDKVGRVTNVTDSIAGTIKLTYNPLDRLTQVIDINGTNSYGYNDVSLRTNMTLTGETTVKYLYDAANRLTNVVQGTFTSSLFYDGAGRRTNLTLPNGIKVVYRYDTASRLTNITYLAAVTNKIDYTYDQTGNRMSQASALAIYNLPSQITNSTYNAANQQLVFGSYNILYDADGNVTNIISGTTTNKLVWSARNQLTNMTGAVTANFLYDGLGRRITRTVGSTTEKYLYDGLDIILQENSSGTVQGRYFRGLAIDEPWERIDVATVNTNRIYMADALGSIVALADTNKVIQTKYAYDPFGVTTTTGAANKNSYKFTAREDDGTCLYYYRARYYHPVLGRFVSEDPIELLGGDIDVYEYVGDNPNAATDPWGLTNDIGDFGWGNYSYALSPGYSAPWVGIFAYTWGDLQMVMSSTYERLNSPSPGDLDILTSSGPNTLQRGFDTKFFPRRIINLDGTAYYGNEVNYFAQGMFDQFYGNVPYWRVYAWKVCIYGEWPSVGTTYWYNQGRQWHQKQKPTEHS